MGSRRTASGSPTLPRVDVIIPAYNAAAYIQAAVASALAQQNVNVEVFVVNGGSSDDTQARVSAMTDRRIHLVNKSRRLWASQARNIGAALGTAPWISYLDADDLWPYNRTAALLAGITKPGQQIACGHMLTFPDGATVDITRTYPLANSAQGPLPGTTLCSRAIHEHIGPFDEALRMGEFIDWMARARNLGYQEAPVPIVALLRRAHAHNFTRESPSGAQDYLRVVAAHIARQKLDSSLKQYTNQIGVESSL